MDRLDKAVSDHRKYNNKNLDIRWLGDGGVSSDPRVRDNSGRMWTRKQSSGGWGLPVALALDTNANVPPHAGIPVEVGYDIKGEQCILRVYREGLVQTGTTPAITNPSDAQVQEAAPIPDIRQFLCKRSADTAKPWAVVVLDGYIEIDGVSHIFNQTEVDFDTLTLVPAAGSKCIACIFLRHNLTLEVFASTPVLLTDPILESHIDECRQQAAADSMSIWGWVLEGDASGLSEAPEKNIDLRPKFQPPPVRSATVATTDATQTTLASIAVAEASLVTITGVFSGVKDDYSAAIAGTFVAGVRRATAGNATLVGVTVTSNEDSGGTPALTVDADTGTQTARLRVTGIAAENWDWLVKYQVLVS